MVIELNRKSGIPLYVQLKQQIREQIDKRIWRPGYKLPTEREMAMLAGVSRNTVSMSYKELEAEGILRSHQGRGTFVAKDMVANKRMAIEALVEEALDLASKEGIDFDEFLSLVEERTAERKELFHTIKIAFIECNREQVDYFAKELEFGSSVIVTPFVISEINADRRGFLNEIADINLIVTTFFHLSEVKALIEPMEKEILGISLDPQLETIVKIARFGKGKKVGLVCLSRNFADKVIASIQTAGINYVDLAYITSRNEEEVIEFLRDSDCILTSPGRKREVLSIASDDQEVVEFVYRPDSGSVNMLKAAVWEYQQRQSEERVK